MVKAVFLKWRLEDKAISLIANALDMSADEVVCSNVDGASRFTIETASSLGRGRVLGLVDRRSISTFSGKPGPCPPKRHCGQSFFLSHLLRCHVRSAEALRCGSIVQAFGIAQVKL